MAFQFIGCCAYPNWLAVDSCTGTVGDDCNTVLRWISVRIGAVDNATLLAGRDYYYSVRRITTNTYVRQNVAFSLQPSAGPFIQWGFIEGFPVSDLPAGDYEVYVWSQTSPGTVLSRIVTMVDEPFLSEVTVTTTPNTDCSGALNSTLTATFTGEIPVDYIIYALGNTPIPVNGVNPLILTGLPSGVNRAIFFSYRKPYSCSGTTGNLGHSALRYYTINTQNVPINITPISTPEVCSDGTGTISISLSNGTAPFSFQWSGPGGYSSTSQNISGLSAGVYTVVVNDSVGCTGTLSVTVADIPDANGCVTPVTCFKAVNCNPDCFGTAVYYLTGADVSPLVNYIVNGLQIDGEVIDPEACWTILETDPSESNPEVIPDCYLNFSVGTRVLLRNCKVSINGVNIFLGNPTQATTTSFVSSIITPGNLSSGFTATAGVGPIFFNICPPSWIYSNASIVVSYDWYDTNIKDWTNIVLTAQFGPGSPPTGCYDAKPFLGYNTIFTTCELCKPVDCPVDPPYERTLPDPVKIFYEIRESKCDITVTKQFATAYSNMLKKIKYGIADCCSGLNIAETWINKQISDLHATIIPGYNCSSVSVEGCSWLPLQGCEILSTPTDGTSILVIAGEDLLYAKLVMLLSDGKVYLNQPLVTTNYQRAIGFTTTDVQMNHTTRILVNGIITNPNWTLTTGSIYFAAVNGGITSTIPTTGISQAIGIAMNPTTLYVDLKQPNIL